MFQLSKLILEMLKFSDEERPTLYELFQSEIFKEYLLNLRDFELYIFDNKKNYLYSEYDRLRMDFIDKHLK